MSEHSFDDNPVALEFRTLRASVARFQEEAHASAVKLQRYSLDSARLHERAVHLERENDLLKAELSVLRANPHPSDAANDSDARSQVQDMTLALRRLSQKLSSTEDALLSKTTELIHAQAETHKAKAAADGAYELGARVRGREEAGLARERHLQEKIVQLEEDARIVDIALKEYAALVREMEATKPIHVNGNAKILEDVDEGTRISATLLEGKLTRSRLLTQFEAETAKLENELHGVKGELEVTKSLLEAEKKGTAALVKEIGNTKTALEKLHLEDGTAAKMVSRYMQFSQTCTNALLSKLSALKARHAGTLSTLSSQNHSLTTRLRASEAQGERLFSTLDELGGEIMRETWGRRREVSLRIRMGGREERIAEGLRRWVRRGDEMVDRARGDGLSNPTETSAVLDALLAMAQDARILLASLDEGVLDEEIALSLSGSKARALLVDIGLDGLLDELRQETERRILLEKQLASARDHSVLNGVISNNEQVRDGDYGVEQGDVQSYTPSADLIANEESEKPPAVPEKSPISTPVPNTLPETTPDSGSLHINETREEISSEKPSIADDMTSSKALEPQTVLFPPVANSSMSIPIESRELPESTPESTPRMGGSALGLSNATEIPLLISNRQNGAMAKEDNRPVPSESLDNLKAASEAPKSSDVPPTMVLVVDQPATPALSSKPSELVISDSTSVLVEDANSSIDTPQAVTYDDDSIVTPAPFPEKSNGPIESTAIPPSSPTILPLSIPSNASDPIPSNPITTSTPSQPPLASLSPFASTLDASRPHTPAAPHPLLSELIRVTRRYDDLQRSFRDCHIALESLKAGLKGTSSSSADSLHRTMIPTEVLNAALRRLDDYTEDARVELEIRISDEALLAKGYEALLSVPGALTTTSVFPAETDRDRHGDDEVPTQSDVERQVVEFIDGSDPAVHRAREMFTRKLEDVQHDIAALKRAIHDPESFAPPGPPPSSSIGSLTPSSSTSTLISPTPSDSDLSSLSSHGEGTAQSSGGWASWIRNASRPASPAPSTHVPSPTFGNIMTTPRLRHAPSAGSMHTTTSQPPSARSRRPSFFGLGRGTSEPPPSPLAALELRVPMPSFATGGIGGSQPLSAGIFGGAYGVLSPTSPLKPMTMAPTTRVRTVSSTMYMLGLGAAGAASSNGAGGRMTRSTSAAGGLVTPPSPLQGARPGSIQSASLRAESVPVLSRPMDTEDEDTEEEDDTDVE